MLPLRNSYSLGLKTILIAAILASGFYVRAELLLKWENNPDHYFVKGEPTFIELDGYYYLQTAKEILNETYTATDNKRAYPETALRPQHPSLLSLSLAYFSQFFGISLNWTAIFLPVVFSLLIAVPLYFFSTYWGSFATATGSITIGILSHYYSSRTSLGRIDTDCLNAVFPLLCAYFFMRFGIETSNKRYAYFSAGIILYLLFLWWWDMSPAAVSVLSLTPLLIALLFHYRPKRDEGLFFYAILFFSICTLFYIIGFDTLIKTVQSIFGQFSYISKQEGSLFPNIGLSIEEQRSLSLATVADFAITGMASLIFAVFGLALLVYKKKSHSLYLLPMLAIGCLGVFFAERFLIFLTPILALGFGFFFSEAISAVKNRALPAFLYALFLGYLTFTILVTPRDNHTFFSGQIIQGMQEIKYVTPENAIVWSWWDEGHPLIYWSERATISDGWIHGGIITYCTALPLSTSDSRLAANFMQFYVVRGTKGITQFTQAVSNDFETGMRHLKVLLANGPEKVMNYLQSNKLQLNFLENCEISDTEFLFPSLAPPVFLFLDKRLLSIQRWINWYGNWNTTKQSGSATLPTIVIQEVKFDHDGYPDDVRFAFNKQNGTIEIDGTFEKSAQIARASIITNTESKSVTFETSNQIIEYAFSKRMLDTFLPNKLFTNRGKYVADFFPHEKKLVLRDIQTATTIVNLLFTHNELPNAYFEPVDIASKDYKLWKVLGEH